MEPVLVLNNDYSPMNVTTLQRGMKLLVKEKAEIVEFDSSRPIVTSQMNYRRPIIIRLLRYISIPYKKVPLTRFNIYRRDSHECQYCGERGNRELTLDHVFPKSRGGKNTWVNLVTACIPCNTTKGNKTPEEANMPLLNEPFKPNFLYFIKNLKGVKDEWKPYIFH